jgi:hypothetical protein
MGRNPCINNNASFRRNETCFKCNHAKYIHTIHIHFVFAVKYRTALIDAEWKERLQQYFVWMETVVWRCMFRSDGTDVYVMLLGGYPWIVPTEQFLGML